MLTIFPNRRFFGQKCTDTRLGVFGLQIHGDGVLGIMHGINIRLIHLGIKTLFSNGQYKPAGFLNLKG